MRHGRATGQDALAELTPEGEDHVRRLGRMLRAEGCSPAASYASTFLRARQTAGLVLAELVEQPRVTHLRELTPDSDPDDALGTLAAHGLPDGEVLVVSHLPLVGLLCGHLTADDPGFAPGTMVVIELDDTKQAGRIVRVIRPADVP